MSKLRGRPFRPGNQFGRGRPKGSRNKSTSAARRLLEQHEEPLMAQQLRAAYAGDAKVRQWCLEQLHRIPAPARKLKLPPVHTLDDLGNAQAAILEAVAQSRRSVAEGAGLMGMLEQQRKLIETQALAARIEQLERLPKEHSE